MRRGRWVYLLVAGALVTLFAGRWLALRSTSLWWARALGAADAHRAIASLRLALDAAAFVGAAVWCVGNLYLVYRQIGSVQVPRRVGNLEIVETIPRRFLLAGAVGIGLILAFALGRDAGDWWADRALVEAAVEVGVPDPILGHDVSYYLFRLPWLRALHGYFVLVVGIVLLLLVLLYGAVGAIRWSERRLVFTDLARWHLGAVLAAFALVLAWGYRLEPAELVAGLQDVPYDGILTGVRIPTARALGALALVVAAASLLWVWLARGLLPAIAWGVLGVASFVGHYVAPAFVAAARGPGRVAAPYLAAAQDDLTRAAFALDADTVRLELAVPDAAFTARHRDDLLDAPLWDHFAVTHVLNRAARPAPPSPRAADRFFDASLAVYGGPRGRPVPLYLAVRQPDTASTEGADAALRWERRHGEPQAYAVGAVAVHAGAFGPGGRPRFVTSLARPDSLVDPPVDLPLENPEVWFAPATTEYALTPPQRGPLGIPAGGFWRRLALAWALQAPRLLTAANVEPTTLVLADRAVDARLARFAPFARFGAAYPVVDNGRLLWVSPGYVASETYPLSVPVAWRGRIVRYLHAGFIGVVDARTGATALYLRPQADPLSRAWAALVPTLVRPAEALPAGVRTRLRYPEELFTAQLALLGRSRPGGLARTPDPFWWAGAAPGDPAVRLRLRAVIEVQVESRVAAVVDGRVIDGRLRLAVMDYPEPFTLPGPSELVRAFGRDHPEGAAVAGTLRLVPFSDGALAIQTFYTDSGTVADVAVGWRGAVGRGRTLEAALAQVRPVAAGQRPLTPTGALEAAREWFRRLDSARAVGDWRAFGEAWNGLRGVLTPFPDSAR
jgi:uncharacterized membrane protein (UPF0182 family)